ncbi:MAG: hypothetical protein P1U32_06070 [Legionellaceae bacterium]|nr:hypothetical protein [Legionellaceae bacterium]
MMRQKPLLIASSSPDEAITRSVLKYRTNFSIDIEVVFIQALLTTFSIDDELSDTDTIVRWHKDATTTFSNQTHCLLNRALSIPDALFSNFVKKDREYAKREFEAYLGYSFSAFEGLDNQSVNGLCGTHYALPEQWRIVQKHTSLNTPNYYWGPKSANPLKHNIVHSDIYNLFNWSTHTPKPRDTHIFCFEKPQGHPVFILSLGQKHLITSQVNLSMRMKQHLLKHMKTLRKQFGYFIFEVLCFVHGNTCTFGCINLELTRSAKHHYFHTFVQQHLIQEYVACLP